MFGIFPAGPHANSGSSRPFEECREVRLCSPPSHNPENKRIPPAQISDPHARYLTGAAAPPPRVVRDSPELSGDRKFVPTSWGRGAPSHQQRWIPRGRGSGHLAQSWTVVGTGAVVVHSSWPGFLRVRSNSGAGSREESARREVSTQLSAGASPSGGALPFRPPPPPQPHALGSTRRAKLGRGPTCRVAQGSLRQTPPLRKPRPCPRGARPPGAGGGAGLSCLHPSPRCQGEGGGASEGKFPPKLNRPGMEGTSPFGASPFHIHEHTHTYTHVLQFQNVTPSRTHTRFTV